jgi:hypothetical protein
VTIWMTILWIKMHGPYCESFLANMSREHISQTCLAKIPANRAAKDNRAQIAGILTFAANCFGGSVVLSSRYSIPETKMLARSQ